jgi:hypothetical protein
MSEGSNPYFICPECNGPTEQIFEDYKSRYGITIKDIFTVQCKNPACAFEYLPEFIIARIEHEEKIKIEEEREDCEQERDEYKEALESLAKTQVLNKKIRDLLEKHKNKRGVQHGDRNN